MLKIKQITFPEFLNKINVFATASMPSVRTVNTFDALPSEDVANDWQLYYVAEDEQYYFWDAVEKEYIIDTTGPIEDFVLRDMYTLTKEQYDTFDEEERGKYLEETIKNKQLCYIVKNGIKEVLKTPPVVGPNPQPAVYDYYTPNLIPNELCYRLGISSLPGNTFMVNDNPKNIIKIGPSGTFNMDFGNDPIYSLRAYQNNYYTLYETLIDIVYLPANEGNEVD